MEKAKKALGPPSGVEDEFGTTKASSMAPLSERINSIANRKFNVDEVKQQVVR